MNQPADLSSTDQGRGVLFQRAVILGTCTLVTILYAMTVTIANVSLPQMQGALSVTQDQITWVVTFNIVATAVATPLTGWLVGRFGRRRLLIYTIIGFAIASLACGLANSLGTLILFRVLQGAFGAPLAPVCQAIVQSTFPRHMYAKAMAFFGMGVILGPIIGPVAGGYLSETYGWRWVFFMIVPFTLMALVSVIAFIRDSSTRSSVRFDWTGFLALSVAVTCLQITLDRGQRADWFDSYQIIILTCLTVAALYIFVAHVATTERPFLRPALLKDRNFVIGVTLMFIFGLLNFTPITLLPTLLQNLRGYPDSVIGYVLAIRGLGTLAGFFFLIVGSRIDPRLMVIAGFATQGISGWYMAQADLNVMLGDLFWPMIVQGFGVGLLWPSITAITFSTLNQEYLDEGTSIYHLIRNMASSIYISISVAVIMRTSGQRYAEMTDRVSPFNQNLDLPWASRGWNTTTTEGLSHLGGEIGRQAAMIGYINSFYMFSITAFAFIPLIFLVRWKRTEQLQSDEEEEESVKD